MRPRHKSLATALVHLGRNSEISGRHVNLPLYQGSTMLFDSLADFESARAGRYDEGTLYYGRYGNPASFELESMLAALESGDHCISVSSGLTAVSLALMATTRAGDHILVADNVYGPSRMFCDNVLERFGVEVTYFDPLAASDIKDLIRDTTTTLMLEAPGTGTFEVPDIPAIASAARDAGVTTIIDGTWATPVFCRPLELGIDIVVHSGSKYISGHADTMIGFIVCKSWHYDSLRKMVLAYGDKAGSQDIFLSLRGLRTLEIRMKHQQQAALKVASWLSEQQQVQKILHPAFKDCPGHEFWLRDFSGSSALFSVLFNPATPEQRHAFIDGLTMFGLGVSWGGFESLALPVDPAAYRTATTWDHKGLLVRFSIGNEDTDELIDNIAKSLKHLDT